MVTFFVALFFFLVTFAITKVLWISVSVVGILLGIKIIAGYHMLADFQHLYLALPTMWTDLSEIDKICKKEKLGMHSLLSFAVSLDDSPVEYKIDHQGFRAYFDKYMKAPYERAGLRSDYRAIQGSHTEPWIAGLILIRYRLDKDHHPERCTEYTFLQFKKKLGGSPRKQENVVEDLLNPV
jgi:hypothetical protein